MGYAYLLQCADDTLYAGSTTDLVRRLREHNTAKAGARYTRNRRPVTLYYSETLPTLSEARAREATFKRMTRAQKQTLCKS